MQLKQLTNAEFKNFSQNFNQTSMYQTTNYAFTMNEENYDTFFLGLVDNDIIKAATLILVNKINGFKYAEAPRGYLIDFTNLPLVEEFTKQIKKFLGKKDIVALKLSPLIIKNVYTSENKLITKNPDYEKIFNHLKKLKYYHLGYNNYFEAQKPRYEAIVKIDIPYSQLFANIKKPFRTKIRKADKDGIKIYHGNESNLNYLYDQTKDKYPRNLDYFKDLYNFFSKDNLVDFYYSKLDTTEYLQISQNLYVQYESLSHDLNRTLIQDRGQNEKVMNNKIIVDKEFEKYKKQLEQATNFLRDYPDGIILSSALVIKWAGEIYFIIDGHDEKYKQFSGKHLLVWKLMVRYSKLGYKRFNLGGIVNPEKETAQYKGLNEFKLSYNAKIVEYAGDFELITNSPLYFMYQRSSSFGNMIKSAK